MEPLVSHKVPPSLALVHQAFRAQIVKHVSIIIIVVVLRMIFKFKVVLFTKSPRHVLATHVPTVVPAQFPPKLAVIFAAVYPASLDPIALL